MILVVGCGRIGSEIARDLVESGKDIAVASHKREEFRRLSEELGVKGVFLDALKPDIQTLSEYEVVVSAVPGKVGFNLLESCVKAGVNVVDVSYSPQDPFGLQEEAEKKGITVVPDSGVAPGLSNFLVGRAVGELDDVEDVRIYVGGIPERYVPPLGYSITWSAADLIDEYMRRARVVRNGRIIEVDPLDYIELVEVPELGELEAFYTDGLRTLLKTIKARNMAELTLRYPGHVMSLRVLKGLGLFDEEPVDVEGVKVIPRKFMERLLEERLSLNVPDVVVLLVRVFGKRGSEYLRIEYDMIDRYDHERHVTAMSRTTAYFASSIAQLLQEGRIRKEGVVPPEELGMDPEVFDQVMSKLARKGIQVRRRDVREVT